MATTGTFNFVGTDVTTTSGDYGVGGPGARSATATEQGVQFSFSTTAGTNNSNFGSPQFEFSVSQGTATLDLIGGSTLDFFSNPTIQFSAATSTPFFGTGVDTVSLIQTRTTGGATLATPVTVQITDAQIVFGAAVQVNGTFNKIVFKSTGFIGIDSITSTINCFLEGTRIATPKGQRRVEVLKPGDRIRTAGGTISTVRWVGLQQVETRLTHPAKVNPICIRAGALADGVPARDLYVSADHAIAVDGLLVNAGALVNDRSIFRVASMPLDGFRYYHVETDAHELLLAEGTPAETFIDYVGRDGFDNAGEAEAVELAEMDMPRISAPRLLPDALRARLEARADDLEARRAA